MMQWILGITNYIALLVIIVAVILICIMVNVIIKNEKHNKEISKHLEQIEKDRNEF